MAYEIMGRVDLHTHTTASDGTLAPGDLVARAVRLGLQAVAITDHDTTAGVPEALAAGSQLGIEVIPGVEINSDTAQGHLDILGYFIEIEDQPLQALLATVRDARYHRAQKIVDKLGELGRPVSFGRVLELADTAAIGRPHIARALLEAGHVATISEAFDRFIGRHGPAYVERYRITPHRACRLVRDAGGVPSLAHPVPAEDPATDPNDLQILLPALVDAGLGGLECFYPGYTPGVTHWLLDLADAFGLIATGGSDFHGGVKPEIELGMVDVPADSVNRLREAARDQGQQTCRGKTI